MMQHIQKRSYAELDQMGTDTMITRITSDVNQVQSGVNLALRLMLRSPFVVIGAMIMAFTVDVKCALIFAAVIPLLTIVVFAIMFGSIPLYQAVQNWTVFSAEPEKIYWAFGYCVPSAKKKRR